MRHSHVSVKIAAENYIVSMLNEFHIDKTEASVTDSMIKLLIDEHRAQLRPSFVVSAWRVRSIDCLIWVRRIASKHSTGCKWRLPC